jgi:hypothetical protein
MIPRRIRTDRGGEFLNDIVKEMQEHYHFEHINSSSRHPQGDGQIERRNRDVVNQLEKMDMEDWDLNLENVLTGIRIRPSARTGLSPYEVMFCQAPRLPLDLKFRSSLCELPTRLELVDKLSLDRFISSRSAIHRDQWKKIKANMKNYENQRIVSQSRFKIGELVMIRNKARKKGDAKWNGPFIVHKLHDRGVVVTLADGKLMPYHESDVKRFKVPVIADHPSGGEFVGDGAEEAAETNVP